MLTPIAEDLWAFEDDVRLPLGLVLPGRTTIVRLPSDRVLVHSPLRIDDERARAIEAIGEPSILVAPNGLHHMFLKGAAQRWPKARIVAAPALERKLDGLSFTPLPSVGICEELLVRKIEGAPFIDEHVFLHPKTRTLIVTDLVSNVHDRVSFGMCLALRCVGAWDKLAQGLEWRLLTRHREAASRSVADVLGWDFDRLVMAHGDVVDAGAHASVSRALRWLEPRVVQSISAPAEMEAEGRASAHDATETRPARYRRP